MAEDRLDVTGLVPARVRGSFLIERVYTDAARKHGLTAQQGVLLCLLKPGSLGLTTLGTILRMPRPSLTGLINRTETNGFITPSADPADAEAVVVSLTPAGASIAQAFFDETCRRIDALTYGLSTRERAALASLLGRFVVDKEIPIVSAFPHS